MKRILLIMMALLLVACGSDTAAPSVEEQVAEAELADPGAALSEDPTAVPPTAVPEIEEAVVEAVDEEVEVEDSAETDTQSTETETETETAAIEEQTPADAPPLSSPEEANVTRDNDYYKGAEEPDVVLIEYGDFQ